MAERLVHQEDIRLDCEGAGDCDPLLHAPREVQRIIPLLAGEPDHFEIAFHQIAPALARHFLRLENEAQIVLDRQPVEQPRTLKDIADARFGPLSAGPGMDCHRAAVIGFNAGNHVEQRRFPAAGRADNADEHAFVDAQADVVKNNEFVGRSGRRKFLGELVDGDGRRRTHELPRNDGRRLDARDVMRLLRGY